MVRLFIILIVTLDPNVGRAGERWIACVRSDNEQMVMRLRFPVQRSRQNDGAIFRVDLKEFASGGRASEGVWQKAVTHLSVQSYMAKKKKKNVE